MEILHCTDTFNDDLCVNTWAKAFTGLPGFISCLYVIVVCKPPAVACLLGEARD
jgi:hypothetical protein